MYLDFDNVNKEEVPPRADSILETYRAIGYDFSTAIADITDNSITAQAKNIWIDFNWSGDKTVFTITDDGIGMNAIELKEAMRPGSRNPLEERDANDLGRFGLGLKTASFSQCRRLTAISKKAGYNVCYFCWDLDYINHTGGWHLLHYLSDHSLLSKLENNSGTIVLWENLDRLVKNTDKNNQEDQATFLRIIDHMKNHIAMVFHRYLEQKKIKIWVQNREIVAWDPFLRGNNATQVLPVETLNNNSIHIKPYILPHISKIDKSLFEQAAGIKGWTGQQGFYIYRKERLIVAGDWLGMFKREPHYNLARIIVDLPNTMDAEWKIDIRKSQAHPPDRLCRRLKSIAEATRNRAAEVYRHRGKALIRKQYSGFISLWTEKVRHGKRFYEINRNHPLIQYMLNESGADKKIVNRFIQFVEETVPVPLITLRENESPGSQAKPFEEIDHTALKETIKLMFTNLLKSGLTFERAKSVILNIEPFNLYPEYIETFNSD